MWNRARVKTTPQQALGQLSRLSRRYNIEKIQKLSANFEKACWRTLRCAEERAYRQKYAFLKHCLNVIKAQTGGMKPQVVPLENLASQISGSFNGDNAASLHEQINANLQVLISSLPSCIRKDGGLTVAEVTSKKAELLQRCLENGLPLTESQQAICKLIEIAKLKRLNKTLESGSKRKDTTDTITQGYVKRELEAMAAEHMAHVQSGQ